MVLKGQKHVRPTSHLQKIAKENISALKNGQKKNGVPLHSQLLTLNLIL